MKFLRQSTIIGALTVGVFLYSNTIGTLPPASAESQPTQKESRFLDTWRWQNYFLLHHNADFIEELAVGDLKHGDTFDVTIYNGIVIMSFAAWSAIFTTLIGAISGAIFATISFTNKSKNEILT
ncbi:DUF5065 family protein [Bacillus paranthracis]|uniref:DUF5065 family protein n=2 Tax=Bacillus cereus group TaxID=86661 RepID=A0A5M9H1N7_9BACI|nr:MULTISPECIES: DUF5065 family protein [Bacillus]ACJ81378.1 group-specific protein [Bacillus cereus AH187]EDZ59079.1 conserved hypothetical protein [Bacillus cereus H3081.97]EEL00492.1 hypothetical protein bcere0013_22880 [Bacillus cereus BDRD-ST26]EJQ00127.1 hypothetical protein IAU_00373 [Bacillus cereus IS075]EJR17632.1 hypothetical protein II7_01816 [Bacillus cereus MSX-A12]EOO88000.1 hypothetical protein IGS_03887 [Bacillus cereus IS845/00]EOO96101.1 hypothetical protein IGQ_03644 [Bac